MMLIKRTQPIYSTFKGKFIIEAFEYALKTLFHRHDSLRAFSPDGCI
jgi:hypothetical protein